MITQILKRFNLQSTLTQCSLFLTLLALLASIDAGSVAIRAFGILGLVLMCVYTASYCIKTYKPLIGFQTINLYISCIIVFLLIHPTQSPLWVVFTISFLVLFKYILRTPIRIFNPAALSLMATYLISIPLHSLGLSETLFVSWWGADLSQSFLSSSIFIHIATSLLLLCWSLYFVLKFRKGLLAGTFFMTSMALVTFHELLTEQSSSESFAFIMSSLFSSIAFMTCIMICEPKTAPTLTKHQALIGTFGGIVLFALTRTSWDIISIGDPFISTILIMNIATYPLKKYGILKG